MLGPRCLRHARAARAPFRRVPRVTTTPATLRAASTPRLVLDDERLERNLARMRQQLQRLRVRARPHVKTCKSMPIVQRMVDPAQPAVTVSTLAEAEACLHAGIRDVLYAVGIAPNKLDHVADLRARGCDVTVLVDHADAAAAVAARRAAIPALIEVDSDGQRAGVRPDDATELLAIARALGDGAVLRGVMTHAGGSYGWRGADALAAMAERERAAVVSSARVLRESGFAVPVVSVGSTPTVSFARALDGVTEVRAGVYAFMDLVMVGLGVCAFDDVALSVLVTVIGHQPAKNLLVTDGGWMALSRDLGTASHERDCRYGLVADVDGRVIPGLVVRDTNQEHGLIARTDGAPIDASRFPIGTPLRVLPIHACATAAQHDDYLVVRGGTDVVAVWPRLRGW
jgi:D-serine deaminase-like pyridoxal phosphate-dependent protein